MVCVFLYSCASQDSKTPVYQQSSSLCGGSAISDSAWYASNQVAPLFDGLEGVNFTITTDDTLVQRYFNQGLMLAYGFNHAEAARSFFQATRLDPTCAMAWWGYAYVLGPNYNAGMDPGNYERAYKAIQTAITCSENATAAEQDLINALAGRYVAEPIVDRSGLDQAYADALGKVHEKYPDDPNIGTLYAEALMDLHPWDLWQEGGEPKSWTPEILEVLTSIIDQFPRHAGAHHLYIHAVEASPTPELGIASSRIFDQDLVPGAGHLIHMPSHIYIRTGDYHAGTVANIRAVKADSLYTTLCHAQGAYPLSYYPHNYHFLAATATLEGNKYWAIKAAEKVAAQADRQVMLQPGWGTLQHYYTIPFYVHVKFGNWSEILAWEPENPELIYPTAIQTYARGMAFLGTGDLSMAKTEAEKLKKFAKDSSLTKITIWDINSVDQMVTIASNVLQGEIQAQQGDYESAVTHLQKAISLEDQLNYDEPPDWFFSVRHHLGAVLLESNQYEEAITVLEEDLKNFPKNGWAHHGLLAAYTELGDPTGIENMQAAISTSWQTADITIESSRIK